ncbi:MAG TPA: PRC-barrel domain-containing protein [Terracidiphilus sp.]
MPISKVKVQTAIKSPQDSGNIAATRLKIVRDLSTAIGFPVMATNGEIGRVRDFLFDDESWQVCSLALDVGSWLRRRDVVLPASEFEFPDWEKKAISVRLTRAEVRNGPHVDSEKPVARQQVLAMREYFGTLASWVDTEFGLATFPTGVKYPTPPGENPHLRSVHHLTGYRVRATDGYLGRLEGILMDENSWRLGYLEVSVSSTLHRRLVAIPTSRVARFSWAEFRLYLDCPRAAF